MAYRTANPVPVVVLMAAALALSFGLERKPDASVASADVRAIPLHAGDWSMIEEVKSDDAVMRQMLADSYVHRIYRNHAGQQVALLAVYRRYGRREFAHRPELCYPAAGFTITQKTKTTLDYAGSERPAVLIKASGPDGSRTLTSYLFASGKKTEEDFLRQQLWMAFERLIPNKNGWTFLRLQSPTITTDDDALAAQRDFMRSLAPGIEAAITTEGAPSKPVAAQQTPATPAT